MTLNYGYSEKVINEIEDVKNKYILQYTLNYSSLTIGTAAYAERKTKGYKYMPVYNLNSKSTITLLTHSFSTSTGLNMPGGVIVYSFEFVDKKGNFLYYDIEKVNLAPLKTPKPGKKYNMFLLNKTYVFSKILRTTDFSNLAIFSVFVTQKSGTLSNDSSELDLFITY